MVTYYFGSDEDEEDNDPMDDVVSEGVADPDDDDPFEDEEDE